jgi:hypothetical protein
MRLMDAKAFKVIYTQSVFSLLRSAFEGFFYFREGQDDVANIVFLNCDLVYQERNLIWNMNSNIIELIVVIPQPKLIALIKANLYIHQRDRILLFGIYSKCCSSNKFCKKVNRQDVLMKIPVNRMINLERNSC